MTKRKLVLPDTAHLSADTSGRLCAPSATRNLEPIRQQLEPLLPDHGRVLELASGTGQQIAALAQAHPNLEWQPTDLEPDRIDSIQAWRAGCAVPNLLEPLALDAAGAWPSELSNFDLIFVVNLFHLVTTSDAEGVIAGIGGALVPGGVFFAYGPFMNGKAYRSEGDAAFDHSLKSRNSEIGYKDQYWMGEKLTQYGFTVEAVHEMPANNLALVARL